MDFSSDQFSYADCRGFSGQRIQLKFFAFSLTELRKVCKIGVFGSTCPSLPNSVTDDPWTVSTTKFNLLSDTLKKITFPTITINPADCFTVTWKAYKQSDNQDLETITNSFFAMNAELEISHSV